jgi:thiosulfate reductase cytochrome b subunit
MMMLTLTGLALAQEPTPAGKNLHPVFPMLDNNGKNVLGSGQPVSTMKTCGGCHDTAYIASHSFHTDVGLSQMTAPGDVPGGHPWDTSPGFFGQWNPIVYRYLTPAGDRRLDLSTADWLRQFGFRHVGGGPAQTTAAGEPLPSLPPDAANPAASILNPATGQPEPWDWAESGAIEMNCFLCHLPNPNGPARAEALGEGKFEWANTATLLGTGIITQTNGQLAWNPSAFTADGNLAPAYITMQDPTNSNCGQCHGLVHTSNETPVVLQRCDWNTATTGEIFSPQRLNETGMNLQGKQDLTRAWDIHAERVVNCVDCHASLNNPVYYQGSKDNALTHLVFDARRINIEDYLYRPSHEFAKGPNAHSAASPEYAATMRTCEGCHDPNAVHDWLPYKQAHFAAVSCESCHIPKMLAPAFQQLDWTVVNLDAQNRHVCRGAEGDPGNIATLITGFAPILLPQQRVEGGAPLTPFNLVSSWYWVYGQPERPVRQIDLKAAWLDGDNYRADVLAAFDHNADGVLDDRELRLDTPEKVDLIKQNLAALGLDKLHINAEIQPYRISHDVTNGEWATKDCATCHSSGSQIAAPMKLASYLPGGVAPQFFGDEKIAHVGRFITAADGSLSYQPDVAGQGLYVFGYSSVQWIDWLGVLAFIGTVLGVMGHAGLRYYAAAKHPRPSHPTQSVYMYTIYERLWHWLQAATIFLLIFTGLIIHKPDLFGLFSFPHVVQVHNVLAFIMLINAFLAVFYHVASGEIRQYIPKPSGFMMEMVTQATYYLRGIFNNEGHPFEKTPDKKLNPLQQVVYFGLLNVLLPLQVITGVVIWGMQIWPEGAQILGGLPLLAPLHSLIAWLLASFIVMHVYLTTTGHTVLGGVQAMINGWDEVVVPAGAGHPPIDKKPTPEASSGQMEAI